MRAKIVEPSALAKKVADEVMRDLCFKSYTQHDVLRVARRITKAYQAKGAELMREEDDSFNTGFNGGIRAVLDMPDEK